MSPAHSRRDFLKTGAALGAAALAGGRELIGATGQTGGTAG